MYFGEFGKFDETSLYGGLSKAVELVSVLKVIENRRDYEKHLMSNVLNAPDPGQAYVIDVLTDILNEIDLMLMPTSEEYH